MIRKIVNANDLPVPTFVTSDSINACSKRTKREDCLLISSQLQDCEFCSSLKSALLTRNWLLENGFTDTQLESLVDIGYFEENFPKIHAKFLHYCHQNNFETPFKLIVNAWAFGSYEKDSEKARVDTAGTPKQIMNGRHRIRMAQILNSSIPVWFEQSV
ncbi:hypothetical protein ACFVR2_17730 [Gottfriedia sp. NPDC057991]|uniref:hypothetical protein n=1 Tax=Gottfriedia sp. NPDC057991 TaxID=3346298 RepID=UPI0036DEE976